MIGACSAKGLMCSRRRKPRASSIAGSYLAVVLVLAGCSTAPTYSGSELFATQCASCHGLYGEGDGPVAAEIARFIPDLRYIAARNDGVFSRTQVIDIVDGTTLVEAHGGRTMPVWGDAFAELDGSDASARARIEALVDYLAAIQQVK